MRGPSCRVSGQRHLSDWLVGVAMNTRAPIWASAMRHLQPTAMSGKVGRPADLCTKALVTQEGEGRRVAQCRYEIPYCFGVCYMLDSTTVKILLFHP